MTNKTDNNHVECLILRGKRVPEYWPIESVKGLCADLADALQAAQTQAVPDGWPTDEMVILGAEVLHDSLRVAGCRHDFDANLNGTAIQQKIAEDVFKAMLTTAPTQAGSQQDGWICTGCGQNVPPVDVTYEEYHDTRHGGCGCKVVPNTQPPSDNAAQDVRNQALEEAAKVCESRKPASREEFPEHWKAYEKVWGMREFFADECAMAIRALKTPAKWEG